MDGDQIPVVRQGDVTGMKRGRLWVPPSGGLVTLCYEVGQPVLISSLRAFLASCLGTVIVSTPLA